MMFILSGSPSRYFACIILYIAEYGGSSVGIDRRLDGPPLIGVPMVKLDISESF